MNHSTHSSHPKPVLLPRTSPRLDLAAIRAKLDGVRGQEYWRSLEEVAETEGFKEMLHREFPTGASEWWDETSRRSFLKMAAATLALAGLNACTKQPTREIYPYVKQPAEIVLGQPLFYATSTLLGGFATGVIVKSREGHPIKVDGNPEHPASLGGSSIWLQASILDLYDPDRSQTVLRDGELSDWSFFLSDLNSILSQQRPKRGAGLRFLTGTITSPTLAAQLEELLRLFPSASWHQYDPIARDNVKGGARLAFGDFLETQHRFDKAAVIVSLDSDFLYAHPMRLSYTRQFTNGRRISANGATFNRLYVAESSPTVTGTMAEHRLAVASSEVAGLARQLAAGLGVLPPVQGSPLPANQAAWLSALVADLRQHRGSSIVIAGEWQPPAVHALAHVLNQALGNVGNTVYHTESAEARPVDQLASLRALVQDMNAGAVETLFILGENPVYGAPADLGFAEALSKVQRSVHLGLALDETAALCHWHIPQTHYLETWGDARAFDGTVSMLQPLIAPLYDGKSAHELLGAMVQQQPIRSDYEIVHGFWKQQNLWSDFEAGWRRVLHDGFITGTQGPAKNTQIRSGMEGRLMELLEAPAARANVTNASPTAPLEICFRPDPSLWDGRFANNGWLQECARPVNKLTWDNAVLVSPALAQRLGLATDDVVEVSLNGGKLRGPVWVMPGQAEHTLTLHLGYGRERVGRVGEGVGFDAGRLRAVSTFWSGTGATLVKTDAQHQLVGTQTHHLLFSSERQVYRATTLREFRANPKIIRESVEIPQENDTLYYPDEYPYKGYKWGMSIDLTTCIGCNACVVACEVENNIPVVGKDQVSKNREMFWIRVDTYYKGSLESPQFNHMPVPCMQCEHAPCELVCPVEATVHDHEGLNLQVYNRCVGTRFCSNNCPYKVRRFNFLRYTDYDTPNFKPMYNPEVTVRWRGVMEKCTYCIQRIAAARITAEKEDRRIRAGEIQTACQQACPAEAIIFGDMNAPGSRVSELKKQPLDYPMLGELNTRPRTTYLAKVTNPREGNA